MRKFKKLTAAVLSAAVALTVGAVYTPSGTAAYAESLTIEDYAADIKEIYKLEYPEQEALIDEIVDLLSSSDEFIGIFNDEGKAAFQIIENSLQDTLNPDIEPIMQTDDLYTSKYNFPI